MSLGTALVAWLAVFWVARTKRPERTEVGAARASTDVTERWKTPRLCNARYATFGLPDLGRNWTPQHATPAGFTAG